jgi:crotonobetainyl-CoA:carnitine CoA-transferase CaiB-like acyl-CoA transferase
MTGALSHLRVIDLTSNLAGPYCAMMLADQGADVVKVEQPGDGDNVRRFPPFVEGQSAPFMLWNRNKRSVALDLKNPDDKAFCRRLCLDADVVVENYRPGVAARLGLGYEELSAEHPGLIYCSISGFGQTGPYRDRGGFDLIAQAMSGIMTVNGPADGPPMRLPIAISDVTSGMFAAFGILSALAARERTGKGQQVDVALLDSAISMQVYEAANYFATGKRQEKLGQGHRGSAPYQIFPTKDGWIALGAGSQKFWEITARLLGRPELVKDERFRTPADRVANNPALVALLEVPLRQQTTDHWFKLFDAEGVPCGPVMDHPQVFADPQVLARDMAVEVDHPAAGRGRILGTPVKLSATPGGVRRPAPQLGEHNEEVRAELDERERQRSTAARKRAV